MIVELSKVVGCIIKDVIVMGLGNPPCDLELESLFVLG